ncbi:protein phosphatase 2C domain-containing protein [Kitasatospora purpeofusca]|uniref:protein phosphatase 2C domain-containing protein n=1 Tax=Kitasatospora purpeofusca TaxID=67352 RepID=UPI002A5A48DD|nr:protein phosphatase 2C domain-containing protein [Kitasatospora purpeofusca]MDY0815391.1 protein phosphatase 2C domain-containing protein [Kitasatospora purpeofusca]
MNAHESPPPAGRVSEPGPQHAPTRKGDPIEVAASVYENWDLESPPAPGPAPTPAPDEALAGPVVTPGRVTPEDFLPRPIGQGPAAVREPWADPVSPLGGPVEPASAAPPAAPSAGTAAPTGPETPADAEAAAGPEAPTGADPVVRPSSFRTPGPLAHVGRKAPAYPAEPTDIPAVRGGDLYGVLLPDTVVDGGRFGPVTVRAASVRGDSHRYAAECRQDAALVVRAGGLLLVAVADGVGSQPHSHHGSNGIVRLLAKHVLPQADTLLGLLRTGAAADFAGLTSRLVAAAAEELAQEAERFGHPPKSWSTTLRALLVPADPEVPARGFVAVGDGGLLRLREGGWENLDADGDGDGDDGPGTLISTRTDCLPEAYGLVRTALITDTRPGDVLVLCTDGLALPLVKEPELREFLGGRWGREVPGLAEFLWQAQVRVRSYDDDRSVVCLWEAPA